MSAKMVSLPSGISGPTATANSLGVPDAGDCPLHIGAVPVIGTAKLAVMGFHPVAVLNAATPTRVLSVPRQVLPDPITKLDLGGTWPAAVRSVDGRVEICLCPGVRAVLPTKDERIGQRPLCTPAIYVSASNAARKGLLRRRLGFRSAKVLGSQMILHGWSR